MEIFFSARSKEAYTKIKIGNPKYALELDLRDRIQFNIFMQGFYEKNIERFFSQIIGRSQTFVDIGSNIDIYCLQAASQKPDIKIIAVEPFPKVAKQFRKNIELNNFENIRFE